MTGAAPDAAELLVPPCPVCARNRGVVIRKSMKLLLSVELLLSAINACDVANVVTLNQQANVNGVPAATAVGRVKYCPVPLKVNAILHFYLEPILANGVDDMVCQIRVLNDVLHHLVFIPEIVDANRSRMAAGTGLGPELAD